MKGAGQGSCPSPPYSVPTERVCQRVGTINNHKCTAVERPRVKGWEKTFHPKETQGDYTMSDNIKTKADTRDEGQYILLKGSIHQEDIHLTLLELPPKMKETLTEIAAQ